MSDYFYAASPSAWTLVGYNRSDSTKTYISARTINWLYLGSDEWTISRRSDYAGRVVYVGSSGGLYDKNVNEGSYAVRSTFSLLSSVTYASGDGTLNSPIRIN